VLFNQAENFVSDATDRIHHAWTEVWPKHGFDFVWIELRTRAPRCAIASAAAQPVNPAPTITTSAGTVPCSAVASMSGAAVLAQSDEQFGWDMLAPS